VISFCCNGSKKIYSDIFSSGQPRHSTHFSPDECHWRRTPFVKSAQFLALCTKSFIWKSPGVNAGFMLKNFEPQIHADIENISAPRQAEAHLQCHIFYYLLLLKL